MVWTKAGQMLSLSSYLPFLVDHVDVDFLVLIGGLNKSRRPDYVMGA